MQLNNRISQYYDVQIMQTFYNTDWEEKETKLIPQSMLSFWLFVFLVFACGLLMGVMLK